MLLRARRSSWTYGARAAYAGQAALADFRVTLEETTT